MRLTRLIFILELTFYLRAHSTDLISKKKKTSFFLATCVCVCVCVCVLQFLTGKRKIRKWTRYQGSPTAHGDFIALMALSAVIGYVRKRFLISLIWDSFEALAGEPMHAFAFRCSKLCISICTRVHAYSINSVDNELLSLKWCLPFSS